MKVLVVHYLPAGENSSTKKLVDRAMLVLKEKKASVEVLDLTQDVPDLFSPERLSVYYERNYGGKKVSPERLAVMARMDRMTAQLKGADLLIVAAPMYNFSQPAALKAWFDAVLQKGQTWDFAPTGGYAGLMKGRKALFISSSGGLYEPGHPYEHCVSLTKIHLGFMGFEAEAVSAGGLNQFADKAPALIQEAQDKIRALLEAWL